MPVPLGPRERAIKFHKISHETKEENAGPNQGAPGKTDSSPSIPRMKNPLAPISLASLLSSTPFGEEASTFKDGTPFPLEAASFGNLSRQAKIFVI